MHFDISIPLVLNIKLIVAKTNSWHTVLYGTKRGKKDKTPHKARMYFNSPVKSLILIQVFPL